MLKREEIIQSPMYDYDLVNELPKAFLENFFEKEKEALSEAIDKFIDRVKSGNELVEHRKYGRFCFGNINTMNKREFDSDYPGGMFELLKSRINKEFFEIIKRRHYLRDISTNHETLELDIVGAPENWQDLCEIRTLDSYEEKNGSIWNKSYKKNYIRLNDFLNLMESKGIEKEKINIVYEDDYFNGTEIQIDNNFISFIDYTQKNEPKM